MLTKFVPQKLHKEPPGKYLLIRIDPEFDAAMAEAKKRTGIPKARLVRQMVRHCLRDMGIQADFKV